jgi:predicted unusual protein kinase regulating ubiquinone biosynthesis (AarF/ABC1/UbiB family)
MHATLQYRFACHTVLSFEYLSDYECIAFTPQDALTGRLEANQQRRAVELRRLLSRLGPSFVKIGQALSARPDLLPKTYLDTLSDLQDRLPSFPNEIAHTGACWLLVFTSPLQLTHRSASRV